MTWRAVFLDRDGVVNEPVIRDGRPYPPKQVDDAVVVRDAQAALERLKERGFLLIVVTNQPDVARGEMNREGVERINEFLSAQLPIDDFFVCYHDDRDKCDCRKPLPGLLFEAANKYQIALAGSYLIGDRWRDIEAGAAAGCRTIFIDRQYNERDPKVRPDAVVPNLSEAADWIAEQEGELRNRDGFDRS